MTKEDLLSISKKQIFLITKLNIEMYLCDNPFNYSIGVYQVRDFIYVENGRIKGKLDFKLYLN